MTSSNLRRAVPLAASAVLLMTACTAGAAGQDPAAPSAPAASAPSSPAPSGSPDRSAPPGPSPEPVDVTAELGRLEQEYDATVGLYAVDTGTERFAAHHPDERFAYASTFKAFAAAAVLERTDVDDLSEVLRYDAEDLAEWSPVAEQHVETGMTLRQTIDAAVQQSDNTAGNLLLEELDGPAGLQAALRGIGDETTIAARWEPELNDVPPGDDRDTTTARAFAADLRTYALGDALEPEAREIFVESLRGSVTGDETIRAGVPDGWTVGNKTGNTGDGTRNDLAVVWPPDGEPIVVAVLTRTNERGADHDDALLADVARVAVDALSPAAP